MQTELEIAKRTILIELKDLGFSDREIKVFQKTLKCPGCGYEFFKVPRGRRWLAHLAHCKGSARKKAKRQRQWLAASKENEISTFFPEVS